MTLVHWNDVEGGDVPDRFAPIGGHWQQLADAAGSVRVGANRVLLAAGQMIGPPHVHSAEEEIFHVLAGSATLWQDGSTCIVGSGDTIVCLPGGQAHTLIGGEDGLDVLSFGTRVTTESAFMPRTRQAWLGDQGVKVIDGRPWDAEVALGLPDGEPGERPANVVALDDVEGDFGGIVKHLGAAGGSTRSGLNRVAAPPNDEGAQPHCHSAEEEVFVILDGGGTLELWGPPKPGEPLPTEPSERHPVACGHVVSRPAGTSISHSFRAGHEGLTYLAFGTRDSNDVAYYPRTNKIFFRGLGLIARLEPLDYFDGEPA